MYYLIFNIKFKGGRYEANARNSQSILLILSMMGTALVGCGKENKTQTNETMGTNETSAQTADDKMGGESYGCVYVCT